MSADIWTPTDHAQLLQDQLLGRAADQFLAGDVAGACTSLFHLEIPRDTYGQVDLLIAFAAAVRAHQIAAEARAAQLRHLEAHLSE